MTARKIILIDIENFNGGPIATPGQAHWCRRMLDNWISSTTEDLIVLAADITTVTNVHAGWQRHRILPGHGENGADFRLLEVMDEDLAARFDEVVLVSGDRIFAEKISWLNGQGLTTTVYSHPDALSKRLRFAANTVITTPITNPTENDHRKSA
ncbi:NYN domain-containing protein [Corynebacterium alimapuense]|uniref:NYN domain-containing protein n=1 Tax=Corynebacterium alimapuense TaxID=1576874 RepID=A0A3M8K4M7_9CORY|nr:NYN domain-containing protein [Corynebacterium alimapuense]RNE48177.1 NYN domain-containing protein [Corynebacterium alimapuense]